MQMATIADMPTNKQILMQVQSQAIIDHKDIEISVESGIKPSASEKAPLKRMQDEIEQMEQGMNLVPINLSSDDANLPNASLIKLDLLSKKCIEFVKRFN